MAKRLQYEPPEWEVTVGPAQFRQMMREAGWQPRVISMMFWEPHVDHPIRIGPGLVTLDIAQTDLGAKVYLIPMK